MLFALEAINHVSFLAKRNFSVVKCRKAKSDLGERMTQPPVDTIPDLLQRSLTPADIFDRPQEERTRKFLSKVL